MRIVVLCGIILLGMFLRFYRLDVIPPGLWYDEAINGLDALTVIHSGPRIFFTTEGHPREPLLIHIISLFFLVLPPSTLTLRATSAFIGLLTIPLVYLFVNRITRNFTLALLSTFFLAVLCWHFHFSRLSFRTILVPPVMLVLFTFLLQAFQTNTPSSRRRNIILAGIMLGLGAYTYLAFRLVPLIIIFLFLFLLVTKKISLKNGIRLAFILFLFAFIVFIPLLIDYVKNPEHFSGRAEEVSLFDKGPGYAIKSITDNAWRVALMFSFRGDHVAKHNLPLKPLFDPFMSFIFYLGIIVILHNAIKRKCIFSATVILWFLVMLLASVLSFGAPNLLRTLGATPAVAVLLASGLITFYRGINKFVSQKTAIILISIILLVFTITQAKRYFHDWYTEPKTWLEFNSNIVDLARLINSVPADKYFIYIPADLYYHPTFRFLNNNKDVQPATSLEQLLCQNPQRPHLIVATSYGDLVRSRLLHSIQSIFKIQSITTFGYGEWAFLYLIKPSDLLSPEQLASLLRRLNITPEHIRLYL